METKYEKPKIEVVENTENAENKQITTEAKAVPLEISEELVKILSSIESPIARYILDLQGTEINTISKSYINLLGISRDNQEFISYMNKAKLERFPNILVKTIVPDEVWQDYYLAVIKKRVMLNTFLDKNDDDYRVYDYQVYVHKEDFFAIKEVLEKEPTGYVYSKIKFKRTIESWQYTQDLPPYKIHGVYLRKHSLDRVESWTIPTIVSEVNHAWNPDNRLHGKAGKTLRKLVPEGMFSDVQWEEFSVLYKMQCYSRGVIEGAVYEEINGDKIKDAYYYDNCDNNHDLGSSCMRYDKCQDRFDIYTKNTNQVAMAVLRNDSNDKVIARSLLWKGVKEDPSSTYFDRIYGSSEKYTLAFKARLSSLGYKDIFDIMGKHLRPSNYYPNNIEKHLHIQLEHWDFEYYPYLDSFRKLDSTTGVMSATEGDRTLDDHENGRWDEDTSRGLCCDICGNEMDEDDAFYIEYGADEGLTCCQDCCSYSDYHNGMVTDRTSVYVQTEITQVLTERCVRDYRGDWQVRNNCVELYDNSYVNEIEDDLRCSIEGSWFISGDENFVFIDSEGEYYDKDSIKIIYDESKEEWVLLEDYEEPGQKEWEIQQNLKEEEKKEEENKDKEFAPF